MRLSSPRSWLVSHILISLRSQQSTVSPPCILSMLKLIRYSNSLSSSTLILLAMFLPPVSSQLRLWIPSHHYKSKIIQIHWRFKLSKKLLAKFDPGTDFKHKYLSGLYFLVGFLIIFVCSQYWIPRQAFYCQIPFLYFC